MTEPSLRGRLAVAIQGDTPKVCRVALDCRAAKRRLAMTVLVSLTTSGCGTPTACLANRYDSYAPRYRCISGVQLPYDILKDTDPNSGSIAPVTVAQ